jgi:predicted transcriptional regulator
MNIGIIPLEQYKQRTIDIAKGIYKPKKDEPKVWFESVKSMAQILSNENQTYFK